MDRDDLANLKDLIQNAESRCGRSAAGGSHVTRAYDEWRLAERELLAFLRIGFHLAEDGFSRLWEEAGKAPSYEGEPAQVDVFEDMTDGLYSKQFEWLLMNLVVRDAVTLYEAYLEKALLEVAEFRIGRQVPGDYYPNWGKLRGIYQDLFAVDVDTHEAHAVRSLRNLLTHRRGELVNEGLRLEYDTREYDLPDIWVRLKPGDVLGHVDVLAQAVSTVDAAVFGWAWGGEGADSQSRARLSEAVRRLYPRQ